MGNFNGNNRGGGYQSRGRSFGGDRGGFKSRAPREMFKSTCSNCGKECEVPFRPTNGKPVYCSDCFEKMGGRDSAPRSEGPQRSSFRAPTENSNQNKAQFDELNVKMDRILRLLEAKPETIVEEVKTPKVKKTKKVASEE